MTSFGSSSTFLLLLLFLLSCVFAEDAASTTTIASEDVQTEDSQVNEMRDEAANVEVNTKLHLGPIASSDQRRQTTKLSPFNVGPLLFPDEYKNSPFNSPSAIKFGDDKENPPPKSASNPTKLEKLQQTPFRPSERDGNSVKFIDDKEQSKEDCAPVAKIGKNQRQSEPIYHQNVVYVAGEPLHNSQAAGYSEENYDNGQYQQYAANHEIKPTKYDSVHYSSPYHQAVLQPQSGRVEPFYHHHYEAAVTKPDMIINIQHPLASQAASYEPVQKPKTVIYVSQEPQQLYHHQPAVLGHLEPPEDEETYPIYYDEPRHKTLSPWKKILKVIGAFIPLGLLFALLPSVLRPNAKPNNNPSIVLSKLRVNNLTPEHKHHEERRLALDTEECREERSICRLLSAADNAGFDFLRNLVLRIVEKTAEPNVRKEELDRIFEAANLGNCDILTCNFYDGT